MRRGAFIAEFWGRCASCSEDIEPGQECIYNEMDEVVHIECCDPGEDWERW